MDEEEEFEKFRAKAKTKKWPEAVGKQFEKELAKLEKYQNKVLNDEEPFDSIMPTLENVTDYFSSEFYRIIHDIGGMMTRLEASETPTRSYIVNMAEQEGNAQINADTENIILSEVMDAVLDDLTEG